MGDRTQKVTSMVVIMLWYMSQGSWILRSLIWVLIYHCLVSKIYEEPLTNYAPLADVRVVMSFVLFG